MFEENSVLNVKRFDALSEEWLEFIKENRSKGGLQHKYDVIIGPVADDNTMETVQLVPHVSFPERHSGTPSSKAFRRLFPFLA